MKSIGQINNIINRFMNGQAFTGFKVIYNVQKRSLKVVNHDNSQHIGFKPISDVNYTDLMVNVFRNQMNNGSKIKFYFQ